LNGIQILMYHQVGAFPPMRSHRATYCDHRRFATQMRWLKLGGYTVLNMHDAMQCLRGQRPVPRRAVVLTFDDAYENFYDYALPHLQSHGFPAVVYAISGMLGRSAQWLAQDGHHPAPLMSAARLRELPSYGIEIGSHAASHVRLAGLPPALLRNEVTDSKRMLEDVLGRPVAHFCYPYGSHDLAAVLAVADAGYLTAVTCERATTTIADDLLTLPRKAVAWGDTLAGVWWKMHAKHAPKRPPLRR